MKMPHAVSAIPSQVSDTEVKKPLENSPVPPWGSNHMRKALGTNCPAVPRAMRDDNQLLEITRLWVM